MSPESPEWGDWGPSPNLFHLRKFSGRTTRSPFKVVLLVSGRARTPVMIVPWTTVFPAPLPIFILHSYCERQMRKCKAVSFSVCRAIPWFLFQNSHKTTERINGCCLLVNVMYLFGKHLMSYNLKVFELLSIIGNFHFLILLAHFSSL